ncbi:MAG: rod shape-determining protein RodA [Elusimicrobia bacterium CG06_land_8_20_14_3_00_38_11]|nr:MAG: rod shape-determining protein RodA [Elusimicrobia bacterium CG06_land_8_20_14_3_00_38_11]
MKLIFKKFDWILFIDVLLLTFTGLLFIFSAQLRTGNPMFYVAKQSTALGIGIAAMLLIISIRYELYREYTKYFYFFAVMLLIIVLFFGSRVRGSKSWFDLGRFAFQPSEIAKIAAILYLAEFIEKNRYQMKKISKIFSAFISASVCIVLILLEPDFSSASVFVPIFLGMMYTGGLPKKIINFAIIFFAITLSLPFLEIYLMINNFSGFLIKNFKIIYVCAILSLTIFVWFFIKFLRFKVTFKKYKPVILVVLLGIISAISISGYLKDYQRKRMIVFLDPSLDPLGSGYNILQSRIAIGSGQLSGRGIFQGTQTQLGFIPDQHTDYIFAVLSEEGGLIFSLSVILLYAVLIIRGISIARNASDRFGSLTAVGIVVMFSYYVILNLGMLTGIMPVAGVPLPFLSYGGSSLIANMLAVGLLINIHIRRYTY